MIPYKLRPPEKDDSAFIFNSWLKSYRNSDFAKTQCNAVYFENHKHIITDILTKSMMTVVCSPEDDNHVFGYVVYENLPGNNLLIHFLYIKHTYRQMGLAKALYNNIKTSENPVLASHYTSACRHIKNPVVIYDPYRMFDKIQEIE